MASAYARVAEQRDVHHRVGAARRSYRTNTTQPIAADREQREDRRRRPARLRPLDHRVRERADGHDEQRLADDVERARPLVARFGDEAQRQEHDDDADRHVDEEDAAPSPVLDEEAAERGADRGADARDRGPDADRARLLLGIGKRGADERERRHVGGGRRNALHAARDVQDFERRREPARDRRQR